MFFLYLFERMCEFGINLGVGGSTEPMVTTGEPSNIDLLIGFAGWLLVVLLILGTIFLIKYIIKRIKRKKK